MAVKHIQLRGISRTPSDRLTEDGGCAESLNVQLDTSEIAPSFIPEDVSQYLNLPPDMVAERIFVHKTANYENTIYVELSDDGVETSIGVIANGARKNILLLEEFERVNDIASLGNTLVISTDKHMYYLLYKRNQYELLGTRIPFPVVSFDAEYEGENSISSGAAIELMEVTQKEWNEDGKQSGGHKNEAIKGMLSGFWAEYDKNILEFEKEDLFFSPVFVRYVVNLYTGTPMSSIPLLVNPSCSSMRANVLLEEGQREGQYGEMEPYSFGRISSSLLKKYKIKATLADLQQLEQWSDVIESIDIYLSTSIYKNQNRNVSEMLLRNEEQGDSYNRVTMVANLSTSAEGLLIASASTHRVKRCFLREEVAKDIKGGWSEEIQRLAGGFVFGPKVAGEDIILQTLPVLSGDDMKHYEINAESLHTYNNSLILVQPTQIVGYNHAGMAASDTFVPEISEAPTIYEMQFILNGSKGDIVVNAGPFTLNENVGDDQKYKDYYGFIIFPDARAYKVIVTAKQGKNIYTSELDMAAHPYLDCAFYSYSNPAERLWQIVDGPHAPFLPGSNVDDAENKIYMSDIDSPFTFPVGRRYTFSAEVVGVAIATTALSQGQFGQFPLYVFTEDGIWAMEIAADGSFVTSKPLSREVCTNPDSITSLDNAVVFVTAQGVMMLQGSQVVNISPNMNGRHYVIENAPRTIIENQDFFCDLLPALSDNTHFLAFVNEATVAYDYAGRRLIFIKKDEKYQYIYKLDTQTWHKAAYDIDLVAPINSYPECLVQGKGIRPGEYAYVTKQETQEEDEYIADRIRKVLPDITDEEVQRFLHNGGGIDVTNLSEGDREWLYNELDYYHVLIEYVAKKVESTCIYDFSTLLDAQESQTPTRGIIATRPLDLGEPDVFKTITDVRIRGQFPKGAVKFILLGSNDGINFATLSTLRGRSWKLFRIIILADLAPTERISWIDVQYETKFTNKLR